MKVIALFSGAGGMDLGFKRAGFDIILANEYDTYAAETYKLNFSNKIIVGDIRDIKEEDIPQTDILMGGFPCQPFSIAGERKGFEDKRGNLFFEIIRIAKKSNPKAILLENVKNLKGHDSGNTFKTIVKTLEDEGYFVKSEILHSYKHGGIPQGRERIFIAGFRDKKVFERFEFPVETNKKIAVDELLENDVDKKYHYMNKENKYHKMAIDQVINENFHQIRRVYVRELKSGLAPTFTANMGTGGHNVPIIKRDGITRKLTPRETFNLQGFPKDFNLSDQMSDGRKYKQSGNAVTVNVSQAIANCMKEAFDEKK